MKKSYNHIIKKLTLALMLGAVSLTLSACGEGSKALLSFAQSDMGQQLSNRFAENQAIVDSLHNAGLISTDEYTQYSSHILTQRDIYITKNESGELQANIKVDEDTGKFKEGDIVNSVSEFRLLNKDTVPEFVGNDSNTVVTESDEALNTVVISNYLTSDLAWNLQGGCDYLNWNYRIKNNGEKICTPIHIIDSESLKFNTEIDCQIYTLSPDIVTADGSGGIDGVVELIQKYVDDDGNVTDYRQFNNYFTAATYTSDVVDPNDSSVVLHEKGDPIMILDILDSNSLVKISDGYSGADIPKSTTGKTGNRPGKDMLVKQFDEPVLKIKFEEFDYDACHQFMAAMGIDSRTSENTHKWVYYRGEGTNRVYLIEYPVYYINGLIDTTEGNINYAEALLEKSDLAVNLKTGKIMNYIYDDDGSLVDSYLIKNTDDDPYLTMKGAVNANAESQSAFFISGVGEVNITNDFSDNAVDLSITTGRLILRDYLEATYAPGFDTEYNEELVVFGRKVRFTNILTKKVDFVSDSQNTLDTGGGSSSSASGVSTGTLYTRRLEALNEDAYNEAIAAYESTIAKTDLTKFGLVGFITNKPYIVNITSFYRWLYANQNSTLADVKAWIEDNKLDYNTLNSAVLSDSGREEMLTNKSGYTIGQVTSGTSVVLTPNDTANNIINGMSSDATIADINALINAGTSISGTFNSALYNPAMADISSITTPSTNTTSEFTMQIPDISEFVDSDNTNNLFEIPIIPTTTPTTPMIGSDVFNLTGSIDNKTDNRMLISSTPLGNTGSYNRADLSQTIIRFNKENECAVFVDKAGVQIENTPKLFATDFCDVKEICGLGTNADATVVRTTAKGEADQTKADGKDSTSTTADSLPSLATKGAVYITTRFPGNIIGRADYAQDKTKLADNAIDDATQVSSTHQVFYAVATTSDLFNSALFSSWVNSDNSEASLNWWNQWLSSNDYLYHLDSTTLEDYLYNNYAYELSQNGIVVLDLETIAKIQKEFEQEDLQQSNRTIRTIFMIIGWVLICYAVILMLCWLIDTNVDVGYQLTSKLTGGHWIPIKYEEDLPQSDLEKRQYVTLPIISVRCLVIVCIGILLILLDVFSIVLFLINTLGNLAKGLSEMLTGLN